MPIFHFRQQWLIALRQRRRMTTLWQCLNIAYDAACVLHEPFRQWVIEDNFADNFRPAWETGGTQFVQSVDAHEHMKLRCLNGTHSTMAYLGCLLGLDTVKEAISDQRILKLCQHLWRAEIVPSLAQPEGEDLGAYTKRLLERYENSNIHHDDADCTGWLSEVAATYLSALVRKLKLNAPAKVSHSFLLSGSVSLQSKPLSIHCATVS